jgi:folate-dependent phosphoribosylglycinamide formyltransferase PurN
MKNLDKNMSKSIVMLCSDCYSTTALYNYISRFYTIEKVVVEEPLRGWTLAKRRLRKLGIVTVAGQVLFSIIVVGLLKVTGKKRVAEIKIRYQSDETSIPESKKIRVPTVNDEQCAGLLKDIQPDIILVNGTRILSKRILESTNARIINMHTGITPMYRGVHGGYWALVKKDEEHCGVTVHLVDKGIDTGNVLYQARITINHNDNFFTYPFLQFGEGIPLVKQVVDDINAGNLKMVSPPAPFSKLWYHPTIWQYCYHRFFRDIK